MPLQVTRYQSSAASMSYPEYFSSQQQSRDADQTAGVGVPISALA